MMAVPWRRTAALTQLPGAPLGSALLAGALLAGCATAPPPGAQAVLTFADLCTPLAEEQVAARAAEYAFAPIDARARGIALPASLKREGVRTWLRQGGTVRAILVWNAPTQSCELAVGGIDATDTERAFAALAAGFVRNGQSVQPVAVPKLKPNSLALRQSVVIGPPALTQGAIRLLSLRIDDRPDRPIQAVLTMRGVGVDRVVADDATPIE